MRRWMTRRVAWIRAWPRGLKASVWVAFDFYVAYGAPECLYPGQFGKLESLLLGALMVALLAPTGVHTSPVTSFTARTYALVSAAGYLSVLTWMIVLGWHGVSPTAPQAWGILLLIQFLAITARFDASSLLPILVSSDGNGLGSTMDERPLVARRALLALVGEEVFVSWFNALEFEDFDGSTVRASVPVRFIRNFIETHHMETLLQAAQQGYPGAVSVVIHARPRKHQ